MVLYFACKLNKKEVKKEYLPIELEKYFFISKGKY